MQTSVYFLISCTLESGRLLFVLSSICRNKTFKVQLNFKFMVNTFVLQSEFYNFYDFIQVKVILKMYQLYCFQIFEVDSPWI